MAKEKPVCCKLLYHQRINLGRVRDIWNEKFPSKECYKPLTILEKTWMSAILIIECMSLCHWLKWMVFPMQDEDSQQPKNNRHRRRCFVDFYALASLLFVFVVLWRGWTHPILVFIVACLVLEMFVATAKVQFVHVYDPDSQPKSPPRSIVLLLFGYATVTLAFALFYKCLECIIDNCGNVVLDSGRLFYFSLMTIATVGYGDLRPSTIGFGIWLCDLEVVSGIFLIVVLLARFIGLPVGGSNSTR